MFIRLSVAGIQDDAEQLKSDLSLLLKLGPNDSIVPSHDLLVVKDPAVLKEFHDVDPACFIAS